MKQKKPWQKISSRRIYHCSYIDFFRDKVIDPLGRKTKYYYFKKQPFIAVIPQDQKGRIWLVRQYRYTIRKFTWEIPMGNKLERESYLDAAKRELAEEACLKAKRWTKIGTEYVTGTVYPQHFWIFLAEDLERLNKIPDPAEISEVKKFTPQEVEKMILNNQIAGASILASLYKYLLKRKLRKRP